MSAVQILIIAALVIYSIGRRFAGSPVGARSMTIPFALTGYGVYTLAHTMHGTPSPADIALLGVELVLGIVAGLARGVTIRLYVRDGVLWQRYTVVTLLIWIAMIAVRVGFAFAGHAMGANLSAGGASMATFGLSLVVESLLVTARATRHGAPIAQRVTRRRSSVGIR